MDCRYVADVWSRKRSSVLLEVHGVLSTLDIARPLEVPERTVRYHLRQMTGGRVVEQEGTARKTRRCRLPLQRVGLRRKDSDTGVTPDQLGVEGASNFD
jgi:predicted ArsR family transcriptional regulator